MRILFISHAFNSLTQRLFVELREAGHEVTIEFDINAAVSLEAVELFQPDLIIAPFLKRAIAAAIWTQHTCLIVHPGIRGDRGPSALDWAILNQESQWGVTVLQANAEMDGGDIWASVEFDMPNTSKAGLYHNEVTQAATEAVLLAVTRFESGHFKPEPLDYSSRTVSGQLRPLMRQSERSIHWQQDGTQTVLRKIRCADGFPGVADYLSHRELFLYDGHPEKTLRGEPGELIARCGTAVCRATTDGAVWIGHLRDKAAKHPFKLPASSILGAEFETLPEIPADANSGYRDIWYEQEAEVGYLHFPFYNGAMGTQQCQRLRREYIKACGRDTKIIVLMGGPDYWSNGMHLNLIEASESAADASWENINAINDLALEIINTDNQLTIAALQGNAGAGGVFLARAADRVWARKGILMNPHYKDMGNLYGSEYWTYLLERYAGKENAARITRARLPMGTTEACTLRLIDNAFNHNPTSFVTELKQKARSLTMDSDFPAILQQKLKQRLTDEALKPLQQYREEELARMRLNFYGFDPSYHVARYNFVYKVAKSRTPLTIAAHRRTMRQTIKNRQ
ncbi:MAG: hydrogenase maturation protein [Proteobacteria bacterium]|nr:hydrogenase maturation protein [Pseudomonadota bacterium]